MPPDPEVDAEMVERVAKAISRAFLLRPSARDLATAALTAADYPALRRERDEAERKEQLWRAEWEQITETAAVLKRQVEELRAALTPFAHCERVEFYDYHGHGAIDCDTYVTTRVEKAPNRDAWWCTVFTGPCDGCAAAATLAQDHPEP